MDNQIHWLKDVQENDLSNFKLEKYLLWCETVSISNKEFQKVVANRKIANWFNAEYEKCLQEYNLSASKYPPYLSENDYLELLEVCIDKIFSRFPSALLEEAKKKTAPTPKGMPPGIEVSLINQN